MNIDIERLAIALQGVPATLGAGVAGHLGAALNERLAALDWQGGRSSLALPQLDLGVIEAPAQADERALADLIAARLVAWLNGQTEDR